MNQESSSSGAINSSFENISNVFTSYSEIPSEGFNCLYKAQRYGKWFILKGLKPEYRNQAFYLELLTKEFELGVKMEHPHIAHTFSKETDPLAGPCIVMEYVDGVTLRESLDRTPPYSRERHTKIVNDIVKQCPACESCRSKLEQYVEQSNLNHHTDFSGAVLAFWEEKNKVAY